MKPKPAPRAAKTPAPEPEPTLATWRAWYPFTLNRSAKDSEQRAHAKAGEDLAGRFAQLFAHMGWAFAAHTVKTRGAKLKPKQAAALREYLQGAKIITRAETAQDTIGAELRALVDCASGHGEAFAVEALCEVTREAIEALDAVATQQPDLVRNAARSREAWPVLASRSRKKLAAIQERLCALRLGDGLSVRGDVKESDSTARAYAGAVRDTLLQNQRLHVFLRQLYTDPDLRGLPVNAPQWSQDCAVLPAFNRENFPAWWAVAEAMLKDQCEDLVDRPEWANTTKHSICRTDLGELRRGTAHTRILDKIKDALHNVALK
jgi:hypothetical protein